MPFKRKNLLRKEERKSKACKMFQLIIGEQHLLRLLFESRKLRLLFKIWQKKRKRTVFFGQTV